MHSQIVLELLMGKDYMHDHVGGLECHCRCFPCKSHTRTNFCCIGPPLFTFDNLHSLGRRGNEWKLSSAVKSGGYLPPDELHLS